MQRGGSSKAAEFNGERVKYEYGDSLEFKFTNGKVYEIEAEKNSDVKTAAEIGIGSSVEAVEKTYGKPDFTHKDKLIYHADNDKSIGLSFKIRNGLVKEIKCGLLY